MQFTVEHPIALADTTAKLYEGEGAVAFAQAAEAAGFDAISFSDHPAPSLRWLQSGGHQSMDPLVALAFCAAATTTLRLMTGLLVLPYRNPLLAAKSIATLDRLSGGRLILGVATGYLRSEFGAVGVDFTERGALLDEALDVLQAIWVQEPYASAGRHFRAKAQVSTPGPIQLPCPPLWIGGNSRAARRRVARVGQGWSPMLVAAEVAQSSGTDVLTATPDLAAALADLHDLLRGVGRDPAEVGVQVVTPRGADPRERAGAAWLDEHLDHLDELGRIGVTRFIVQVPSGDVDQACDALAAYGQEVIARMS